MSTHFLGSYYNWAAQLLTHVAQSYVIRINTVMYWLVTQITPKRPLIYKTKVAEKVLMEHYHVLIQHM